MSVAKPSRSRATRVLSPSVRQVSGDWLSKTDFNVTQLVYWGAECSYIEVLEIADPPPSLSSVVIVYYNARYGQYIVLSWCDAKLACKAVNLMPSALIRNPETFLGFLGVEYLSAGQEPWPYKKRSEVKTT